MALAAFVTAGGASVLVPPQGSAASGVVGVASRGHPRLSLPPTHVNCRATAPVSSTATSVPLAVNEGRGAALALVSVCINQRGPFPMVLDTGAQQSTVDEKLVDALRLRRSGPARRASGAECTSPLQPVSVTSWSLGPVTLQPQTLQSTRMPAFGLHRAPAGVLGSDVLSRFGAVRIDYGRHRLLLPGPEGPAPSGTQVVRGPTSTPTPPDLLAGHPPGVSVPIVAARGSGGEAVALAPVQFNPVGGPSAGPPLAFVVDTGSSRSAISSASGRQLRLRVVGHQHITGLGCGSSATVVWSGRWSLPGKNLTSGRLVEIRLPVVSTEGIEGLLGSDQLSRFGSVVIDYAGGRLIV